MNPFHCGINSWVDAHRHRVTREAAPARQEQNVLPARRFPAGLIGSRAIDGFAVAPRRSAGALTMGWEVSAWG